MERILVVRGGAIGDFVLTLPALKLLRDAFPDAWIEILGYKHIVALVENRFYAQAVRSLESGQLARFFAKGAELPPDMSAYFGKVDLVLSYLFDPDKIFEENVRRCGVEKFLAASPKITGPAHAARHLARPLVELGLQLNEPAAILYPSAADQETAARVLRRLAAPIVALHPGSGSETKNWPIKRWLQLAEWLLRSKYAASLLVIAGEADRQQLDLFRAVAESDGIRLVENLPLPELAAVFQNCTCFIGHDSGISHIAAAVATPSVLLFGPTDPAVWAPQNHNVRVLRGPGKDLTQLPCDVVAGTVQELMRIGIRT
ncbi:MAG: glycosyltransferase family 9 protein [Chthoniobacterales bacterium]|nr:glycosyltransferase family 9 protein [Chthoniobacterales bacterium]